MISNKEIHLLYGRNVVISRKQRFALVHLDRPSLALVRARTREFDAKQYFDDDCAICRLQKEGGIIIFDDRSFESVDEDILIE